MAKKSTIDKYRSTPKTGEKEVGGDRIDRTVKKPTFQYFDKPTVGTRFHIFRQIGDELEGIIIGHAISNVRRNSSYPLKLDSGEVVEFFANKQLHGIIRDFELIFSRVRIVYIGRNQTSWGHAAKVYRVYKTGHGQKSSSPLAQHLKSYKAERRKSCQQKP